MRKYWEGGGKGYGKREREKGSEILLTVAKISSTLNMYEVQN